MKLQKNILLLFLIFGLIPVSFPLIQEFKEYQIKKYLASTNCSLSDNEKLAFEEWITDNFVKQELLTDFNINNYSGKGLNIIILNDKIPFVVDKLHFNAAYDPTFDIIYIDENLLKYSLEFGLADNTGEVDPLMFIEDDGESEIRSHLLAFVFLHELGHRKLHNHYNQMFDAFNYSNNYSGLSKNHKVEIEADSFALHNFRISNTTNEVLDWEQVFNSIITMTAINMLYQIPSETETLVSLPSKSHPSLINRTTNLLEQISQYADTTSTTKEISKLYSYLMSASMENGIAEIASLKNDNVSHILQKTDTLIIVFESGKIGVLDFSPHTKGSILNNLKQQRILKPKIIHNTAPKVVQDVLNGLSFWDREHLWIRNDTIFMISPSSKIDFEAADINEYTIHFAHEKNKWKWEELKKVSGFQSVSLSKFIELENKDVVIYGDNEDENYSYFYTVSMNDTIRQAKVYKSKYSDFETDNLNISWSTSFNQKTLQYITIEGEGEPSKSSLFQWTFTDSISKELLFELDQTTDTVPNFMELYEKENSVVGVKQSKNPDSVSVIQYDKSGTILNQTIISGMIPYSLINQEIIEKDWIGSLDSWEIDKILVLQESQKLLIQFYSGGVVFFDLKTFSKSGHNFFCDISNISFELKGYNIFISKLGGSPTASIFELD